MSRYLIDTDWAVDVLHGQQTAIDAVLDASAEGLAISLISYAELYEGAFYARNPAAALAALAQLVADLEMLPLTVAIAQRFAILRGGLSRAARQQIGDMDLLIAATALEHDLTLLTRNRRDFELVPGLAFYGAG